MKLEVKGLNPLEHSDLLASEKQSLVVIRPTWKSALRAGP